ncbi:hypothetical protein Tmar_1185 [Thermaerobacter marianensis DSM 12885]|uniref:Uncharacterized protein n=1 Tax=Thermaerobacter marianensis (strain ATCC 700841 / DSM 12885 / JCM 10246 / 7p75a) TaxID=644966 RepID=E6SL67_THEM7|nr:CD1247 N-terminal domain-containing protein [Thermaerobacter marianensis]ADU51298.1 hypothetical protein Tmar_1185 [Thermaerobacter marianensis DSM 12885]
MGRLRQRVAYLNGLAAGIDVAAHTPEGRVLAGIIDVLDAMAEEMERLDSRLAELAEYLDELDQDLFDLEEAVNGEDDGQADDLWGEEEPLDDGEAWAGAEDGDGDRDEAAPADFEGAVVFESGIPTRGAGEAGGRAGGGKEDGGPASGAAGRRRAAGQYRTGSRRQRGKQQEELVDGLLLECPHCGTTYAVARDQLEFDRAPEDGENEFEWECPNCGEIVHDFLPDADPDEQEDPLTAERQGTAGRPAGDGAAGQMAEPGRPAPTGPATSSAPAPVAPF